jgi:sec-independent protein translocase protein TatC
MPLDQIDVDQASVTEEGTYEVKRKDEMSFWEHLNELRGRIMKALLAILIGVVGVFIMGDWIFNTVIYAPIDKSFPTYKLMCDIAAKTGATGLCITPPDLKLFTTEIGEVFFKHMQIALILGLMVAIPFVFYQFWLFIKPGLMDEEIKAARGFVTVCSLLFLAGMSFGYFIITPFAVSFLANYQMAGVGGTASLASYVGYLTMFTLPIGIVFELPVIIYFLSRVGMVTPSFLKKYRKHMVVVLLVVAGIITPSPDMVSQLLVFVPLYTLYEVGIMVSRRVEKQRQARLR